MEHDQLNEKVIRFAEFPVLSGITLNNFGDCSFKNTHEYEQNVLIKKLTGRKYFSKLKAENGQFYGNKIIIPDLSSDSYCEAEGLVCFNDGFNNAPVLIGNTGDCPMVLLTANNKRFIALLHLGWKGILQKNIKSFIDKLEIDFPKEISPVEIIALIWPGICGNCYEVGDEFHEYFPGYVKKTLKPHSNRVDLKEIIFYHLRYAGVKADNIYLPEGIECSAHIPLDGKFLFASKRREAYRPETPVINNSIFISL